LFLSFGGGEVVFSQSKENPSKFFSSLLEGGGYVWFLIEAKKTLLNFFSFGGRLFIDKVKKTLVF
jgi:hypothetical protein